MAWGLEQALGEPVAQVYAPLLQCGGIQPYQGLFVSWILPSKDDTHTPPLHPLKPFTLLGCQCRMPHWHTVLQTCADVPEIKSEKCLDGKFELLQCS